MAFWALLAISIGFHIVTGLLQRTSKPKQEERPKLPSNDGSKAIPVVFGDCLITDPFLMDYLDFKVEPIKIRNPATFFITTITVGYRYYLGIVFGLCWGKGDYFSSNNPQIKGVTIDNRSVLDISIPGPTIEGFTDHNIDLPTFFGSEKQEGGVVARLRWYDGSDPNGTLGFFKDPDPYWEAQRGLTMPDYKCLAYVVWHGPSSGITINGRRSGYIGNSTRLWPIAFRIQRYPVYLDAGYITVGDTPGSLGGGPNANPVECLYETLIDPDFGAAIPTSQINFQEWKAAAIAVHAEALGFSYLWNTSSSVEDMALEILRFIDATIWTDLQSGLIRIKLARAESTTGIPSFTNDDFAEIQSFTRGSWEDTRNEVKITFPDHTKIDHEQSTIAAYDIANFNIQGASNTETIHFGGCPTPASAGRLAMRELRALSRPYARLRAKIDRKAWLVSPGSIFKFSWPEQGITDMVMRCTSLKLGTIVDGTIEIAAVEDVFRAGDTTYGAITSTVWTDPLGGDAVDATASVGEIPYFIQRDDLNRVFGVAARPTSHVSYDGALDGEAEVLEVDFTPSGLLVAAYPQVSQGDYDSSGFAVNTLTDSDTVVAGSSTEIANGEAGLAILGDPAGDHEWIAFESKSGTTTLSITNVWRGILDTPPRQWPAGTRIWFWSTASAMFVNQLGNGQIVNFEALTRTMRDQLTTTEATNHNYTIQRRAFRPLPPYYVRMGGSYTNEQQNTGDLVFTWREHTRLVMPSVLKQSATDEDPESGVTWELDIYDYTSSTPVLIRQVAGLSSPTYTYLNSDELSDLGSASLAVRLKIDFFAKREGLRSLYPWTRIVYRTDPGSFAGGGEFLFNEPLFNE